MGCRKIVAAATVLVALGCETPAPEPHAGMPPPSAAAPAPAIAAGAAKPTTEARPMEPIPANLEQAFTALKRMLPAEDIEKIRKMDDEKEMVRYHFGLGMRLRNEWGLWRGEGGLGKQLRELGLRHPDDMSTVVLESFWRHLHGKPLELEAKVRYYQEYWDRMKKKQEADSGSQ